MHLRFISNLSSLGTFAPGESSFQLVTVILRFLIGASKVTESCFQIGVPQEVLDCPGIYAGSVEAAGKGLPPLVKSPFSAHGAVPA